MGAGVHLNDVDGPSNSAPLDRSTSLERDDLANISIDLANMSIDQQLPERGQPDLVGQVLEIVQPMQPSPCTRQSCTPEPHEFSNLMPHADPDDWVPSPTCSNTPIDDSESPDPGCREIEGTFREEIEGLEDGPNSFDFDPTRSNTPDIDDDPESPDPGCREELEGFEDGLNGFDVDELANLI